jgi:hypothetical protein
MDDACPGERDSCRGWVVRPEVEPASRVRFACRFAKILREELECSRLLEDVAFGEAKARVYRSHVSLNDGV